MCPLFGRIVLNEAGAAASGGPAAAGERLQHGVLTAIGAFTRADGCLDYGRLRASPEWREVVVLASALPAVSLGDLNGRHTRLAFWINVYNALVFHGVVALGVRWSMWETPNFFGRVSYRIGGFVLSADEIEHGILRGNARRVVPPFRCFGGRDPRLALASYPVDPRVHFAITCGARSCPPVGVYRAATLDGQLDRAARNFLNQEVALDGTGSVSCSRILKWYGRDFDAAGGLTGFLLRYLDEGPVRAAVLARARPCDVYRSYDWAPQHEPAE